MYKLYLKHTTKNRYRTEMLYLMLLLARIQPISTRLAKKI